MEYYEPKALRLRQLTLIAALLVYVASYVQPPGSDVAAVFGILAVLLLATYHFLDEPRSLASAWIAPTIAAVVVLATTTVIEQRLAALAVAAFTVFGSVGRPVTESVANLRERATEYLR